MEEEEEEGESGYGNESVGEFVDESSNVFLHWRTIWRFGSDGDKDGERPTKI